MKDVKQNHLDDLTLELWRTGEAEKAANDHIAQCAACRARAADFDAVLGDDAAPPAVRDDIDRAIRLAAKNRAADIRGQRRRAKPLRYALPAAFAAAAALLLVLMPAQKPGLVGDINGDGRIDIVDAMLLDRALSRGEKPAGKAFDMNRDERVDADDVEYIALAAVSLGEKQ